MSDIESVARGGSAASTSAAVVRTFLIADIRGYSTFTRERGDEAAARLARRFAEVAREAVEARNGEVLELRGDEAFAVFGATDQAVRAALEFQQACREETDADPELPLPVGVGIDRGEAIPVEGGFRGSALNMAARLCSKAAAGQVLVTANVADEMSAVPGIAFHAAGTAALKGFDRPVELLEARFSAALGERTSRAPAPGEPILPIELDDGTALAGRQHELRWLRGTWRQARRGRGRVVLVSGPPGIGKTRVAAELARDLLGRGEAPVRYAGSGGAGGAAALALVAEARSAGAPGLFVVDDLHLHPQVATALATALGEIEDRPALVVGLFRPADGEAEIASLVERADARGDGHRRLAPVGAEAFEEIARSYVGGPEDLGDLPAEAMLRASGGVPARLHEALSEWVRDEAERRLAEAAEFLAAGRSRQAAGLEFAGNAIAMRLGRIYGTPSGDPARDVCPYKGLSSFEPEDAETFFGRERLVGELAARTVGTGLLGLVGPSGSGKSSVVMAGLLPSLAAGLLPGSERWGRAVLRPGEHPMAALETTLLTCDPGTRLVLVVDQFEEVFTTTEDGTERDGFIQRLVEMASEPDAHAVVATIRADYTGHVAPYPELAEQLAANLVLVGPMSTDELRRAIELPARRAGLRVESALADALVDEVADEPGGLPLLSTALVELWRARDEAGWLRLDAHERTGGVRGAVARLAEDSYERLGPAERDAVRSVLLRLVGEGEGEAAVRRRVPVPEFDIDNDAVAAAVLGRLTEDRLLTRGDGMVEIAHEALIREWPRLRGWLEEDATGRQLRGHLTQAARQWDQRGRDPGDLYRGARLSATLDWAQQHDRELNALEREFLAQGRQGSEREAERQRRTNRRLRGLLVGVALFLVVALVAGALALIQRGHARDAQSAAEAQSLRSDAERVGTLALTEPNLDRSYLLGTAGVQLQDLPETRGDLLAVLQKTPALVRLIHTSDAAVTSLAVSPDGALLASGDSAGVVWFHDLDTFAPAGTTVQLEGAVTQQALDFSPDSGSLAAATATGDDRVHLYLIDVASREAREVGSWDSIPAALGPLRFTHVDFSPDGSRLAVAVATSAPTLPVPVGERLFMLDSGTGDVLWEREYPLREAANEAIPRFTRGGVLVTSAQGGETLLWGGDGGIERRFDVGGPFALSPDGRVAAVARNSPNPIEPSARMALLDLVSGDVDYLEDITAKAWIVNVSWTPDAETVVGADFLGGLDVWDVPSGRISQTFSGGLNVVVTPDGGTVVSEGVAWDLAGSERLGRQFRWHPGGECALTPCFWVDPAGGLMAETLGDGRVGLADLASGRRLRTLPARNGEQAEALAFTPDGRTLVTGGINGHVTLWDVGSGEVVRTLEFDDPVWWVAVSPDGKLLAVQIQPEGSPDSHVEVVDLESGDRRYDHDVPGGVGGLEFGSDGRALAALGCCEGGSTVQVWDAETGAALFSPKTDGHVTSIAFSPDGNVLAGGTEDGSVVMWDGRTGGRIGSPIQVATGAVDPISFSPDGRMFVATSTDQTSTLWDVRTRKRIGDVFPVEQGSIPVARFTSKGELVLENLVTTAVWPIDVRSWIRFACDVAGRDLARGEWADLLPERPYEHVCPQPPAGT